MSDLFGYTIKMTKKELDVAPTTETPSSNTEDWANALFSVLLYANK